MQSQIVQAIQQLEAKEQRLLQRKTGENRLKQALVEKVPAGLSNTLETAFFKAFELVFLHGTRVIEKTFDRESAALEFEAGDYVLEHSRSKKSIRRLDKASRASSRVGSAVTTATGLGLGLLGLGLPDIPLLVGTILRGLYEIAVSYGFSYESDAEQIYLLRLIRTALAPDARRAEENRALDSMELHTTALRGEIEQTAKALSDALLVEKFVQGLPIVGVVGGFVNHAVYRRIAELGKLKYKKRYLLTKLQERT